MDSKIRNEDETMELIKKNLSVIIEGYREAEKFMRKWYAWRQKSEHKRAGGLREEVLEKPVFRGMNVTMKYVLYVDDWNGSGILGLLIGGGGYW